MHDLARAVQVATNMRDALEVEIDRARAQRHLIRKMESDALLESARARATTNAMLAQWEGELAVLLAAIARDLGLDAVTLDLLAARAPEPSAPLRERLGELRALGAALRELDSLNQQLTERALAFVRGYVGTLVPKAAAYDRRGAAVVEPQISTAYRTV